MAYFACFGYIGLVGLFFSCVLIAFCGAKALLIVKEHDISGPHSFNKIIGGKICGRILTLCCGFFSFFAYVAVLAGMKQLFNGSLFPVVFAVICSYIVLYRGFTTMANICGVCAPLLAAIIAVVALAGAFLCKDTGGVALEEIKYESSPALLVIKVFVYAGYNILTSLCVLGRCRDLLPKKRTAVFGGLFGGIMLFISGAAILCGMVYRNIPPQTYEMPVLALFGEKAIVLEIVIFITLFLSAITGLTGTCVFFEEYMPEKQLGIFVGLAALPLTYISFGNLFDYVYPIFGFVGIFLMIILALMGSKKV